MLQKTGFKRVFPIAFAVMAVLALSFVFPRTVKAEKLNEEGEVGEFYSVGLAPYYEEGGVKYYAKEGTLDRTIVSNDADWITFDTGTSDKGEAILIISGTPTSAGTYTFSWKRSFQYEKDGELKNISDDEANKVFTHEIIVHGPSITTESPLRGTVDVDYSKQIETEYLDNDIEWSISGELPEGISFDTATGVVSGKPVKEETTSFTITAKDSVRTASKEFKMEVRKTWDEPEPPKKDKKKKSSSNNRPVNPDEIEVHFYVGGVWMPNYVGGKQAQGPVAQALFTQGRPEGWTTAFDFNLVQYGKAEYTLKNGRMILYVPGMFQKEGRQFAITALDKNGQVLCFMDQDVIPQTVTVDICHEGYAFELLYKD